MKASQALHVGLLAAALTTGSQAQSTANEPAYFSDVFTIQSANTEAVEKGYINCLRSENDDVVESSLAHVASLKLAYPVKEFKKLQSQVEIVAKNNPSQEVRYMAFLVSSLLENPSQFAADARVEYSSPDELFGALASRLQMIASNRQK